MVKDLDEWITVKQLHKKGMSIRAIAKELKISKNTVKKLLRATNRPTYTRGIYTTKIDAYKEQIRFWYLDPNYAFIGTRIYEELLNLGYNGSISPIYRYLTTLREEKIKVSSKATVRIETPPGDQAQFDWAHYTVPINGLSIPIYCFSLVLAASRFKVMTCSLKSDAVSIHKAIEDLYHKTGGVTVELLIDNPKGLVLEHLPDKEPKYNREALILTAHLGVELNACMPYRAKTKGKVERPFNYLEEHFIKGNNFKSMEDLNTKLEVFLDKWNHKIHSTTKRIPAEAYLEEKQNLLPLPGTKLCLRNLEPRVVSLDSLISVSGKKYSVPVKYVEKKVYCKIFYGYLLEIYSKANEYIASYDLTVDKNYINKTEEHYKAIETKVSKSIPEIKRLMTSTFYNGEAYLEAASKVLEQPSYHARQLLRLIELYPIAHIEKMLDYCLKENIYAADDIKNTFKEKYDEIIFTSKQTDLTAQNETNVIRNLDYYEHGGETNHCNDYLQ